MLSAGMMFRGTVTQAGVAEGHSFRSVQDCTLIIDSCSPEGDVVCKIARKETHKTVDGSTTLEPNLPVSLRSFLLTWRDTREIVMGNVSERTKVMILDRATITPSDRYFTLVKNGMIVGVVIESCSQSGQISLKLDESDKPKNRSGRMRRQECK
jgi:hypothetical protein